MRFSYYLHDHYERGELVEFLVSQGAPVMAGCYECDRPYGDEYGFPDMLVPGWVWKLIMPERPGGGGLLCPSCICYRAAALGLQGLECQFTSGPFAIKGEVPFDV